MVEYNFIKLTDTESKNVLVVKLSICNHFHVYPTIIKQTSIAVLCSENRSSLIHFRYAHSNKNFKYVQKFTFRNLFNLLFIRTKHKHL